MKFLHISDLHIGSALTTHLDPKQVTVRRREILDAFRRAVEFGVNEGVDAVLIAGDLFDTSEVGVRMLTQVRDVIRTNKSLPFFYVSGNHEGDAFLETGKTLSNFYTFGETFTYYDFGEVRIHGANTTDTNMFSRLEIDREKKNIVLLHGEWADRSAPDGVIGLRELEERGVDYLALGHYHSFSVKEIFGGGVAVYAGTPEGRGFDEAGQKGVVLFDTSDFVPHFYPLAKRTVHVIEVDSKGAKSLDEVLDRVDERLRGISTDDLVELKTVGACDTTIHLDEELFYSRYKNFFWHFVYKNKTTPDISIEDLKYDVSIQGEFTRLVLEDGSLSEEEKRDILECGLLAMLGERWTE